MNTINNFKTTPAEMKAAEKGQFRLFKNVIKKDKNGKDITLLQVRSEYLTDKNDVILFHPLFDENLIKFIAHFNIRQFYFRNIGRGYYGKDNGSYQFFVWKGDKDARTGMYKLKYKKFKELGSAFDFARKLAEYDKNEKLIKHIARRKQDIMAEEEKMDKITKSAKIMTTFDEWISSNFNKNKNTLTAKDNREIKFDAVKDKKLLGRLWNYGMNGFDKKNPHIALFKVPEDLKKDMKEVKSMSLKSSAKYYVAFTDKGVLSKKFDSLEQAEGFLKSHKSEITEKRNDKINESLRQLWDLSIKADMLTEDEKESNSFKKYLKDNFIYEPSSSDDFSDELECWNAKYGKNGKHLQKGEPIYRFSRYEFGTVKKLAAHNATQFEGIKGEGKYPETFFIAYSPDEKKWFGWSQRGFAGFNSRDKALEFTKSVS